VTEAKKSLQERWAPTHRCFGCGQANEKGLRLESFPVGTAPSGEVVAHWSPEPHHLAFEGVLNGGIIGTLLDCHSNWTAAWHLMCRDGLERPPTTVTADFHVRLRRPTPTADVLTLSARVTESDGERVQVEASLTAGERVTATCTGRFIAVGPGHPAYEAW
jgi:acyl-coenzyme A thioesterase PaaI-like protein